MDPSLTNCGRFAQDPSDLPASRRDCPCLVRAPPLRFRGWKLRPGRRSQPRKVLASFRGSKSTPRVEKEPRKRLGREALGAAAVGGPVEEVQDDALAEAALADLEGLAEELGDLLQEQDAGGEDADATGVELEAPGDVGGGFGGEDADRALQGLVLEHRAD